ncbi:hypothetical protein PQE68_gp086 [Bacillus phage vB_BanS_Sophrita]|uniref:Uncharacterized protein n=1 Tax=Bacillus phage vB_BanS_Sophrita TaxID=2894790 RepID=A0AAE8YU75_9CAUD|nr:hypothetical protein PQE68_gp086 [Bacillus phage vB_BanS_Sophrita]UGO50677.1 hypothetical protein SOPHRITA_86 [Bacillus phage vB_BanS_Sophrita]
MADIVLIEKYGIVTEEGWYIIMEQTGNESIDVMAVESPDHADLFDTYEEAQERARDILKNNGEWDYWVVQNPVGVVKIEKTVKVGTVKGLR